ncbi:hypothetical protein [Leptospira brenneri]|uniref:hypothetical protein n=1 Tax=Leptospira brenneri TaxID=2023182 RepID=UPI000C2AE183|nr:hypothetical protein [Leptospira brenneri]PJZ44771.1 hypothetical protein CH361_14090 [Leptospira brenneri]
MKSKLVNFLFVFSLGFCSEGSESEKKDFKVLSEAFRLGHISFVNSILKEKKEERELTERELTIYFKTLFYSGQWKELFSEWSFVKHKPPEMVLLYFKALLLSKEAISVSQEDEVKLLELLPVSPEACLLYLKIYKKKTPSNQKKIFSAQSKQFQTHLDRLHKELGE